MPRIDKTARPDLAPNTMINSNVPGVITSAKFVSRYPDTFKGRAKKGKGRERWEIETDGLGNFEVEFTIPTITHNMKDTASRQEKVEALARKAAKKELAARHSAHVN